MGSWKYTEEELEQYFNGARSVGGKKKKKKGGTRRPRKGIRGYFDRRFDDPRRAQAAFYLSSLAAVLLLGTLVLGVYFLVVSDDLPSFSQLDNPHLEHATVAFTADGVELAHYFVDQNRSWVPFERISPHVVNALVATEDKRFYDHWGIDAQGIAAAAFDAIFRFDLRGASTVTQQLARNLYRQQIGPHVSLERKLKEMVTAVQLERRYTKREIIEMYLNTVAYIYSAYGIEAASKTFFNKTADEITVAESATLVGMLQNPSLYNPVRFPENARKRRNVVLRQMVRNGYLERDVYESIRDEPVTLDFKSPAITEGLAPHFSMHVREWLEDWAAENDIDNIYGEGLLVYTTIDSRMQELANQALKEQLAGLQDVVDYEWSRCSGGARWTEVEPYAQATGFEPFECFWRTRRDVVVSFIKDTPRYRSVRATGLSPDEAVAQLQGNPEFIDSLKTAKTRIEGGLVSVDPRNGHVKAWVGGREIKTDWFDHVTQAARQPGSTFKPFVYATAIDNGYSPEYMLPDSSFTYTDPWTGEVWAPTNFGSASGGLITLREALATSNNLVTARVITQLVNPQAVVRYAHGMGIKSPLEPVPALGLGTSDVTLLELTSAYSTLANGGLAFEPTLITRIEDRRGNVLYEAIPAPEEALSQETAYTVVDMLRGTVDFGTAQRIRGSKYGLQGYDLAAKTGTTQNAADGWFMLMHPELVTGAWVGWNDRRIHFRDMFWGQGAHNALFVVGDYYRMMAKSNEIALDRNEFFPTPSRMFDSYREEARSPDPDPRPRRGRRDRERDEDRVGW